MGRPSKRVKPVFAINATLRLKALKWNAHRLAKEAKIAHPTVRDILAGVSPGLDENKVAIANALGASMAEMHTPPLDPDGPKPIFDFAPAADFLSKFAGLSPVFQKMALSIVYQDAAYLRGVRASEEAQAEIQKLFGPLLKAK